MLRVFILKAPVCFVVCMMRRMEDDRSDVATVEEYILL